VSSLLIRASAVSSVRLDVRELPVEIEVGYVERQHLRHEVVLVIDQDVIRHTRGEGGSEGGVADRRRLR
jgi:hypothetical protein